MRKTDGFLEVDGASLEYRFFGPSPSEALTLIFLHEGLGCVSLWKDFPEQVAKTTGCGVLVYSRAGYGRSSACTLPRPLSFMHDEALTTLPRVLDAAGVREAILVGHSDGASIALIHAGGARDARVKGLVAMAPHVFVEEITVASIRAAREAFEGTDLRERLARHHGDNVDCAFWGWNGAWLDPGFRDWNIEGFLPGVEAPVLLIQGEDDNYGTARQMEAIDRELPKGAEILLLPDCGHSPFRDRPQATLRAITRFVMQLPWLK